MNIGGNAHPASHQWDDGANPIDQMTNIMTVRRKVLDNFSEKSILDGEPMVPQRMAIKVNCKG
jgi:hypothetical protein